MHKLPDRTMTKILGNNTPGLRAKICKTATSLPGTPWHGAQYSPVWFTKANLLVSDVHAYTTSLPDHCTTETIFAKSLNEFTKFCYFF